LTDIKWNRLILSGLIAGVLWTLLSVVLILAVGREFMHSIPAHHDGPPSGAAHIWLFSFTILTAVWGLFMFALIRPRFARRNTAAVVAALSWWLLGALQSGKWIALLEVPPVRALLLGALTMPAMVLVTVVGAWLYERGSTTAVT
jgi:hypothetical protein